MKVVFINSAVIIVTLATVFNGCSSSSSSSNSNGTSGVGSDPYIVGAKFYDANSSAVSADGNCSGITAYVSVASNKTGSFNFSENITTGNTIKICQDQKGYHNGSAFDGNISSVYNASNTGGTVSPITTLIAGGINDANITSVLNDPNQDGNFNDGVGYPDYNITTADLYLDPMSGLDNNVTAPLDDNATFARIRASIAINMMMKIRSKYNIVSISDLNASGTLAASFVSMKAVLNTNLPTQIKAAGWSSITAANIASIAASIADGVATDLLAVGSTPNAAQISTIGYNIGNEMYKNQNATFKVIKGGNWNDVSVFEVFPSGSTLTVNGRMIEINKDINATFYSDYTYSDVNSTHTQWGTWLLINDEEISATIVEDNVTGVALSDYTRTWTFSGDTVKLDGGSDLNITDGNTSVSIDADPSTTAIELSGANLNTDLNGSIIILDSDSVYSRLFDTNGTYRQKATANGSFTNGTWIATVGAGGNRYTITVSGIDTNITKASVSTVTVSTGGIDTNRTVSSAERLQY